MSDYLHEELLSLFLKRLPVKTLLRCRSVCKCWKEVIDSQSFIGDHVAVQKPLLLAQNQPFEYLVIDPHTLPFFHTLIGPIEPDDDSLWPFLICCVHGVICLHYHGALHLWNPSIQRLSRIPLTNFPNDPITSDNCKWFSFWIDPSNHHSKIVIVRLKKRKIHLFSSRKQAWTQVDLANDVQINFRSRPAPKQVLINGAAHWIAYNRNHGNGVVVYFDFMDDKFGTIDLPGLVRYNTNVYKWQDSLSVVQWAGCKCDLWAMQNGSWAKMFSLKLVNRVADVLYVDASHSRILAQNDKLHLVLYDPKIWRKRTRLRSEFIGLSEFSVSYDFVESLVFPDLRCISSD